jgi:thiaminase
MGRAAQLVAEIRGELETLDREIREHPYPAALGAGNAGAEALRPFVGHQYHIVQSDLRSMATLVQRFGHTSARDFFAGVLQGEIAGLAGLLAMARKIGMDEAALADYEVAAEGFAYATFMAWQSTYASAAAFTCGILVNFEAWGYNCGRMSNALRARHGFATAELGFLEAFATMPSFEEPALAIIQEGLDHGVAERDVRRAARLFQEFEKMFWDTMERLSGRR